MRTAEKAFSTAVAVETAFSPAMIAKGKSSEDSTLKNDVLIDRYPSSPTNNGYLSVILKEKTSKGAVSRADFYQGSFRCTSLVDVNSHEEPMVVNDERLETKPY